MDKHVALLKKLQTEETFEALTKLYGDCLIKWGSESPIRDNEYETLKALFINEGKIQGINEFFKIIENYGE